MRPSLSHTFVIGFLCLLPAVRGAEPDPNALPPGAVARLGWSPLRIGYSDFTLSPDGRSIIVVTPQGNLRRLDAQTGRLLERRQLTDHSDVDPRDGKIVHLPALSANGETVAVYESSYTGCRVTVYDVASGKRIFRRTSTDKRITDLGELSSDGKQLTLVEQEGNRNRFRLRVFDFRTGRMKELDSFVDPITIMKFSADGKRLLAGLPKIAQHSGYSSRLNIDHTIVLFDLSSGKKLWNRGRLGSSFAISRDGRIVIASGLRDNSRMESGFYLLQMDAASEEPTERFVPCQLDSGGFPNELGIAGFALAPDDRTLVINHFDEKGTAYIVSWDVCTRKEIRRFKLPPTKGAQLIPPRIAISADGRTLLTNAEYLQRWDLASGKPFFSSPADDGLPGSVMQLAFTPDGKEVFASSIEGVSGRWNIATGKRIDLIHDHYGGNPFIRTPNGLRTIRQDGSQTPSWFTFAVLDPVVHKTLHTFRYSEPNREAKAYTLTANGKTLLAIHSDEKTSHVTAWNVTTGRQLSRFSLPGALSFPSSPFSPCGRWVVLNGALYHLGRGTKLFAPAGSPGERLMAGEQWPFGSVWFSEDGRLMAAHLLNEKAKTVRDSLAVWELASGRKLARFDQPGVVTQVAFGPDGRTIALLDAQRVRLLDLHSGRRLAKYPAQDVLTGSFGYTGESRTLVFSPDGCTLATGHHGGSIMLWKVPSPPTANSDAMEDGEAEKLWKDLGSSSPVTARAAVDRLACHPDAAAALLAKRFRPPPVEAKLATLIADLDSEVFATREEASRQLRAYGARAEVALRQTLAKAPSLEMRRRIENILAEMVPPALRLPLSGERLHAVRAIEVLERAGNAAARRLLHSWAEQTEDVQLTIESQLALERQASSDSVRGNPRK